MLTRHAPTQATSLLSLLMICGLIGCNSQPATSVEPSVSIESMTETAQNTTATSDEIVIDVRSLSEWESGHVQQAVHIPHTEIASRIAEITSDKDARIVVYCAVGGRAGKAKSALEELGFKNVENAGGYEDVKQRYK